MRFIVCANRHVFDADVYGQQCPYCRKNTVSTKDAVQKPVASPANDDPLEATARVRRAAPVQNGAPKRTETRDHAEPAEVSVRTPWGFRNRAPKAADDWTKPAPVAPVKNVSAEPQAKYDEEPMEHTMAVRPAANGAQPAQPVRTAPVSPVMEEEDPMEQTFRAPRGMRKPAPKAVSDWTKAATPVPAAEKPAPAPSETVVVRHIAVEQPADPVLSPEQEEKLDATMAVRRIGAQNPSPAAPAAEPAAPYATMAVRRVADNAAQTPAAPENTVAVRRIAVEQPADPVLSPEQEEKLDATMAVRRVGDSAPVAAPVAAPAAAPVEVPDEVPDEVPAPEDIWVDDTGLMDHVAAEDAAPAEEPHTGVYTAELDGMNGDAPEAGAEENDGGLFVAELDDMDPDMNHDDSEDTGEEDDAAEAEWDPEAQMDIDVQLVEVDDAAPGADEAEEQKPEREVLNAPSGYKPMWDAKVGAEDQAIAEDFSMVMGEAALAALPEEQAFYTPIVSVSELMESEDPGEAPEAWEDEWESDAPGLVRISSLDAIEDFRSVDAGILEDVDDDVLLAHRAKVCKEYADDTRLTVHLVPAYSETMKPRQRPVEEVKPAQAETPVVAPAPVAPAAPMVSKPAAPVVGWLVCTRGGHYGESFPLVTGRNSIGRTPDMDVPLLKDESVTEARHAILTYEPRKRQFFIQPGESTGLVYLNDQLVFQYAELKAYDRVEFGDDAYLFMPLCGPSFGWDAAKDAAK